MLLLLSGNIKTSKYWSVVMTCSLISCIVLAVIVMIAELTGSSLRSLTIDPADVELRPAYIGMLSHFGVMLWAATAAICFFASSFLKRSNDKESYRFLSASAIISTIFLLDDALLLHDRVFPTVFGIPEIIIYTIYAGIILSYFVRFAHTFRLTEYRLLLTAASMMVLSIIMDSILPITSLETFIEDGLKFTGILFWSAYFINTAVTWLTKPRQYLITE
jgi:hypothetical protein